MNFEEVALKTAERAKKYGADQADVYLVSNTEFGVQIRKGEIETLTQSGSKGLGVRVFVDHRQGFASTSDFSEDALDRLIKNVVALAASADQKPENELSGEAAASTKTELGIYDPELEFISPENKIMMAKACESAAFALDSRVTNSEGAGFGNEITNTVMADSLGNVQSYQSTACSIFCAPLAEYDGKKQVDYDYSYRRVFKELDSPDAVGRKAAERVIRKLGARKAPTQSAPVVFENRVAARIWSAVIAAINGDAVFKGMSFLKGSLNEQIAAANVTLIDDGTLFKGAGSAPFDGEGLPTRRNVLIENGVLKMFQFDTLTARKVGGGVKSTANARRSANGSPSIGPFNVFLSPGQSSPEQIISGITNGFYVTDMMGSGANPVTGDFSIGASGSWIENGKLTYAVEEVTIAASMQSILMGIENIGSDLIYNSSIVSPTFQVSEMTISGE